MNRRLLVACLGCFCLICLGCSCLGLLAVSACDTEDAGRPATPATTVPQATTPAATSAPAVPAATPIAATGEEVERLVTTGVQRVTWEDGTTYEETIADLVFRTAGMADAGRGCRTVAGSVGGGKWEVTIFMRVTDLSTEPATSVDLRAEFYYDDKTGGFTAVNGRAEFALTGHNHCPSSEAESDRCPLDKQVFP